jgi:hypothetical protein
MMRILLFITCAVTAVLGTPYNITVADQSPTIEYSPSRYGADPAQTWTVTYNDTMWTGSEPGSVRLPPSYHFSTHIGATATFGFKGTAVYIYGVASVGDAAITVGGEDITQTGGGGYLGWKSGLKDQWWEVVVKVKGSGGVRLESIECTINLGNDGSVNPIP